MLNTYLSADVIHIVPTCKDWREAVSLACQPLIDNGTIEPRYVDAIFRSHEAIGPYYVVGPGIAMPHARPEEGARRKGIALTLVKEGVNFGSEGNDPVKLLFVLAATDSNSHIDIITALAGLFDSPDDIAALTAASDVEQLLSIISRY